MKFSRLLPLGSILLTLTLNSFLCVGCKKERVPKSYRNNHEQREADLQEAVLPKVDRGDSEKIIGDTGFSESTSGQNSLQMEQMLDHFEESLRQGTLDLEIDDPQWSEVEVLLTELEKESLKEFERIELP